MNKTWLISLIAFYLLCIFLGAEGPTALGATLLWAFCTLALSNFSLLSNSSTKQKREIEVFGEDLHAVNGMDMEASPGARALAELDER